MFIGHYAAAPLAVATGQVKLWQACLAVQLVDIIWSVFILLGIEKATIVPGFTQGNPMDLHFMPYSHSLMFTFGWAVIAGVIFKLLTRATGWKGALLIAALVLSHWVEDVIVHVPDMTLWPGSMKLGLGLWNNVALSFTLEMALTLGALAIFIRMTHPKTGRSVLWTCLFTSLLIALQAYSNFGHLPTSIKAAAMMGILGYVIIALAAGIWERTRTFKVCS